MVEWFDTLDVKIQTALIAAAVTLFGIVLKDYFISLWNDRRRDKQDALLIYRSYSDPISSSASSLFWRLRETMIEEGRGAFLKSSGTATQFEQYKYESTLYRLAVLIGWLRAFHRELTLFSLSNPEQLKNLRMSIQKFEAALSDGAHIETQRVRSLADIWGLSLPGDSEKISSLGVAVDHILQPALAKNDAKVASDLTAESRKEVCMQVAHEMTARLSIKPLNAEIIHETVGRAIQSLSIREAWLYRDYQSGIGDLMIKEVSGGTRRFDLLGFADFEKLLTSRDPDIQRWMERFNRIIEGLDISGADRFDARVGMLEETFLATIGLLKALDGIDSRRRIVSREILSEADKLIQDLSWRKSTAASGN